MEHLISECYDEGPFLRLYATLLQERAGKGNFGDDHMVLRHHAIEGVVKFLTK
jgi:hypothetical protein